jgi:hypothetical protein
MKAILIDPWEHSVEQIEIKQGCDAAALQELYKLVGEDGLDWVSIMPGECICVGDHSALQEPPLASYMVEGIAEPIYGRGVLTGYDGGGNGRDTALSPDFLFNLITWCSP